MALFRIVFSDGQNVEYHNVSKLTYISSYTKESKVISSDLEKYQIPIGLPLWLSTENGTVGVSGENIRLIEVTKD